MQRQRGTAPLSSATAGDAFAVTFTEACITSAMQRGGGAMRCSGRGGGRHSDGEEAVPGTGYERAEAVHVPTRGQRVRAVRTRLRGGGPGLCVSRAPPSASEAMRTARAPQALCRTAPPPPYPPPQRSSHDPHHGRDVHTLTGPHDTHPLPWAKAHHVLRRAGAAPGPPHNRGPSDGGGPPHGTGPGPWGSAVLGGRTPYLTPPTSESFVKTPRRWGAEDVVTGQGAGGMGMTNAQEAASERIGAEEWGGGGVRPAGGGLRGGGGPPACQLKSDNFGRQRCPNFSFLSELVRETHKTVVPKPLEKMFFRRLGAGGGGVWTWLRGGGPP